MVFTLMSAIAAKAQQNAALIAILGFPVILPILLLLMRLSQSAFAEGVGERLTALTLPERAYLVVQPDVSVYQS